MLSTTGADDTMQKILSGDLNAEQMAALQSLIANPEKTLGKCPSPQSASLYSPCKVHGYTNMNTAISNAASLTAYKYLLDTQSTLQATVDNVNAIGGDNKVSDTVLQTIVPIMQQIESTIDKMGDDFSIQKFDPAEYVFFHMETSEELTRCFAFYSLPSNSQVNLLDLVSNSSDAVNSLGSLNLSFATSTTVAIKNVQSSFDGLEKSIREAAEIPIGPFPTGTAVTCAA